MKSFTELIMLFLLMTLSFANFAETNKPQQNPILVLKVRWGEVKSTDVPIGKLEDGLENGCFTHFAVSGKKIFIADGVFHRIAVFEGSRLVQTYPLPTENEIGMVVSGDALFELDRFGYLIKLNLTTSRVTKSSSPVVLEGGGDMMLAGGKYVLYSLGEQLVINRKEEKGDVCVNPNLLKSEECLGMPKVNHDGNQVVIVLNDGKYVKTKNNYAILHSSNGVVMARAYWPDSKILYADPAWLYTNDGIYYAEHSRNFVKIFFQAWNPTN